MGSDCKRYFLYLELSEPVKAQHGTMMAVLTQDIKYSTGQTCFPPSVSLCCDRFICVCGGERDVGRCSNEDMVMDRRCTWNIRMN